MKKLVSSVLSLAMLLSLAACSGGDHSSTSAGGSTSSNTGSSANTSGDSSTAPQDVYKRQVLLNWEKKLDAQRAEHASY